jgi:hypothetical protein
MREGRPTLYRLIPGCRGASREQSREHRGSDPGWSRMPSAPGSFATRDQIDQPGMGEADSRRRHMNAATSVGMLAACLKARLRCREFRVSTVSTTADGVGGVGLLRTQGNISIRRLI